MTEKPILSTESQCIGMIERVRRGCQSTGLKMTCLFAAELMTGGKDSGRAVPAAGVIADVAVSVTILSRGMDRILTRKSTRGDRLPRAAWTAADGWMSQKAVDVARQITGAAGVELALMGRALGLELWDEDPRRITLCFNFLLVCPELETMDPKSDWRFAEFKEFDLNRCDPREALILSEALCLMGLDNPYENSKADEVDRSMPPSAA